MDPDPFFDQLCPLCRDLFNNESLFNITDKKDNATDQEDNPADEEDNIADEEDHLTDEDDNITDEEDHLTDKDDLLTYRNENLKDEHETLAYGKDNPIIRKRSNVQPSERPHHNIHDLQLAARPWLSYLLSLIRQNGFQVCQKDED
jgi:hypothetical protein